MNKLSPHQLDALERVQQKPVLQPLFFQKIDGLKWFDELRKKGFFDPRHNPRPEKSDKEGYFVIPGWPILAYLEKVAPEFEQKDNRRYAEEYIDVIRKVTKHAIDASYSNNRTWWYFAKTLTFLPVDLLLVADVDLMTFWLDDPFERSLVGTELGRKLLPRLLAADTDICRTIALALAKALTSIRWNQKKGTRKEDREPSLPVDSYHAKQIFPPISRTIGAKFEREGVEVFHSRLLDVLTVTGRDKYSTLWRRAIEDHEQDRGLDGVLDILIDAFRDALSGYVDRRAAAAIPYVEEMLGSDVELVRRTAIHVTGEYADALLSVVSKVIVPEHFSYRYQHETYHFIRNCFARFDENTKQRLIKIIDELGKQAEVAKGEPNLARGAYERLKWLSAIKGLGDRRVDELYEKNLGIVGTLPEHPDFSSYSSGAVWVGEISPYSAEELLSREFGDLVNILTSFREGDGWKAPTRRGLAQELRKALVLKPQFFERHLEKLLSVDFDYVNELLAGYGDLWKDKKYDNWVELLQFCRSLLNSPRLWGAEEAGKQFGLRATHTWIVGQVADLIRAGTTSDDNAFDPNLLPQAKSLIEFILEHQEGESYDKTDDPITTAINSARGRTIEALMNYSLRCCRLADEAAGKIAHSPMWLSDLQAIFDREVARATTGNYEFVALFGRYIPNLLYINQDWTLQQLPKIFDKTNRKKWLCAMDGYGYNNGVYESVYAFLRNESHFRAALDAEELDPHIKSKVIQNIVIAYFQGHEDIKQEAGILNWLMARRNAKELSDLVWFVWTLRGAEGFPPTEKILALWKAISDSADPNSDEGKAILSRLSMWSVFISELDAQVMELLEKLVPFADNEYNAYILVEELKRLVDKYPQEVAEIFWKMMSGCAPTYQQEDVEYILTKLFKFGLPVRDQANAIVDAYVERGIEFPARIRDKSK